MKVSLSLIALAAAFSTSTHAETINFDDLAVGTILSNQYAGVTFTPNAFSGAGTSSSTDAWATNTDMTIVSSLDSDVGGLGAPSLVSGNILRSFAGWLGEDGDPSFLISFATPITNFSATFAGVTTGTDVTIWAYNGSSLLGSASGTDTSGSTGQFVLSLTAASITQVAVRPGTFNDWVGVDNITYTTGVVPENSTWAMMGLGLGLLALKRHRQG